MANVASAIPFVASSHEHTETLSKIVVPLVTGAAPVSQNITVPSTGFIRHLWLDVVFSGGTGGSAVAAADAPWNVLDQVTFIDTNSAPIYGPVAGYSLFVSNLFGGYTYQSDPRCNPIYTPLDANGNGHFQVRIPIELSHHDATGCLGNQNAAAPYRVTFNVAALTSIFTTPPATLQPTVTITPVLETWTLPNATDAMGRPQSQFPPNYGTVQYWSQRNQGPIGTGQDTAKVLRVGNLIRNIIFICRDTSFTGARADTAFPTQPILSWDDRNLTNEPQAYRAARTAEVMTTIPTLSRPTGVFAYTFDRSNQDRAGDDKPWGWIPTVEATRLELTGSWTDSSFVTILVNDVAPGEVNPTQRYVETNATGFHPDSDNNSGR